MLTEDSSSTVVGMGGCRRMGDVGGEVEGAGRGEVEEADRTNAVALAAAMASPLTSWLAVAKATYIGADPSSVMESKLSLLDDEDALSLSGSGLSLSGLTESPCSPLPPVSCSPPLAM